VYWNDTDRWPLPTQGLKAEADVRLGLSGVSRGLDEFHPVVGVHGEIIRWWRLGTPSLVLGARALLDATAGPRPYFDLDVVGGRERDELGFDQALSGYGASRSRGPAVGALLLELRVDLFAIPKPDLRVLASVFAEEAWLAVGLDPGPHMPSVGVAPEILLWGGIQVRPYAAWGWWSTVEGAPRTPRAQLGLSLGDPL
jgi:hypothetical protein